MVPISRLCGGTASIFADALNCRNIPIGDFHSFEHHAILLKSQPPVLVITIYRPPKQCPLFSMLSR